MNGIIYIVGLVVVIGVILSFFGLRYDAGPEAPRSALEMKQSREFLQ